jgi:hypothetical protein
MLLGVMPKLNRENTVATFRTFAPEVLAELEQAVQTLPTTEAGWSGLFFITGGYPRPDISEAQRTEQRDAEGQRFRQGVEAFRAYLAARREEGKS